MWSATAIPTGAGPGAIAVGESGGLGRRALRQQGRAHRPQRRPRHHRDPRRRGAERAGGDRPLGVGCQQRRRDAVGDRHAHQSTSRPRCTSETAPPRWRRSTGGCGSACKRRGQRRLAPTGTGGVARVAFKDDPGSLDPALALRPSRTWQIPTPRAPISTTTPTPPARRPRGSSPRSRAGCRAVSEDGLRYTFTIRPGFRFSPPSNAPVTAQTFRHVIERTLSPRWHASVMDSADAPDIVGLRAYQGGHARHISGLSASGDRLDRSAWRIPIAALPQRLALPFFCAVPDNAPVAARPRAAHGRALLRAAPTAPASRSCSRAIPTTAAIAPPT